MKKTTRFRRILQLLPCVLTSAVVDGSDATDRIHIAAEAQALARQLDPLNHPSIKPDTTQTYLLEDATLTVTLEIKKSPMGNLITGIIIHHTRTDEIAQTITWETLHDPELETFPQTHNESAEDLVHCKLSFFA